MASPRAPRHRKPTTPSSRHDTSSPFADEEFSAAFGIAPAPLALDEADLSSADVFRLAIELQRQSRFAEAEALLARRLERDNRNAHLKNARGVMLAAMDRHLDATWSYRDAVTHAPDDPSIWTNLGNALTHQQYLRSAVWCHRRALALATGDRGLFLHNLGISLSQAGEHAEAVAALTQALEVDPQRHMARWDRARNYLYLGNYIAGFADYEIRRFTGQLPDRPLPGRWWNGEPYAGKRLLVLVEQGFGDSIWAARYLSRVKALGGELAVECQSELIPLFEEMGVVDRFVPKGAPLPEADLHRYFCSLPGLFTRGIDTIPQQPFLSPPPDRLAKFRALIGTGGRALKVGIVWSGSLTFKANNRRAQPLLRFFQGFAQAGVQLYSLQKGPPEEELAHFPQGSPIVNLAPHLHDFADTSAAVSLLDLIIMTDSAVAHLAGSMGKPVWVLLGHVAHWLWLTERTDCPWYPSMRLFRPRAEGDWDHVFDCASLALMDLVAARETSLGLRR